MVRDEMVVAGFSRMELNEEDCWIFTEVQFKRGIERIAEFIQSKFVKK